MSGFSERRLGAEIVVSWQSPSSKLFGTCRIILQVTKGLGNLESVGRFEVPRGSAGQGATCERAGGSKLPRPW